MCKSGVQIHNPRAVRLLDTSNMGASAGIILREFNLNVAAAAAYAERMAATVTVPAMAADYAAAAADIRNLERT